MSPLQAAAGWGSNGTTIAATLMQPDTSENFLSLCRLADESSSTPWTWALISGIFAVAAQLVLVWGFEFFPSVDGPAHVHLAHAMYEALRGDSFYGSLVEINSKINPNIATQSILVMLMAVAPPFVAEKIWLSLYFVSFAGTAAYALYGINRNSLCLLPLLVFCGITFAVAFGFYNFAFSTVVFLAWLGYWWRHRSEFRVRVIAGHALFALLAYTTHIFAFAVTLLGIGLVAFPSALLQASRECPPLKWHRSFISRALPPLLGSIPELLACINFLFVRFSSHTSAGAAHLIAEPHRFAELLSATSFAPYDRHENVAACAFALTVLSLLVYFARKKPAQDRAAFAACFGGFLLLYLVMPQQWIVRWMPARFQPLVFIASLLWLAALMPACLSRWQSKAISALGLVLLLLSVGIRLEIFGRIDEYYREYASAAPHIDEGSTLIALRLHDKLDGQPFPADVDVLIQAGSRIASLRHSIDLKNFQGQSNDHPIQFRPGISATALLGGDRALTSLPPRIKLMAYERQTGRPIDYVLLYGFREAVPDKAGLARIDDQLRENYHLVFVSKPTGLVHLYARNAARQILDRGDLRPIADPE